MANSEFTEGTIAYADGLVLDDNPYIKGTQKYGSWREGWKDAEVKDPTRPASLYIPGQRLQMALKKGRQ